MNEFEWTPISKPPKEDKGQVKPCLLWIWDSAVSIGYVATELAYWTDGRWVDYMGDPLKETPDQTATYWCYVNKARRSRNPFPVKVLDEKV